MVLANSSKNKHRCLKLLEKISYFSSPCLTLNLLKVVVDGTVGAFNISAFNRAIALRIS